MAAPTFIAASSAGTNTASATVTCNYPAGSASGDLLVMMAGFQRSPSSASAYSLNTPSGWTLLNSQDNSRNATYGEYGQYSATYYRFRGAETSVSVVATNSSNMFGVVMIHAFDGSTVDPTTPISVSAIAQQNSPTGNNAARPCPSVTTPTSDNVINCFASIASLSSGRTFTWGITERTDAYTGLNADLYLTSATTTAASAGATGVFNITPSAGIDELHTATVAVQPPQELDLPVTDSVASAETQQVVANVPTTDAISAASETATISMPGTDGITRSETAQVIANTPAADATQSVETQQVIANVPATDSTSVSESAYVINVASASDSAQAAESASVTVNVTDTATFTETQAGIGQETASFGENQAITVTVSDGISTSEDAFSATAAQGDDGVGTAEQASISIRGTDSVASAETQQVVANTPATDGVSVGENQRLIIHVTDSMSSTETAAVRITVADSVSSVDSASVIVTVFATDGMSAAETTVEGVSDTDSATFTESAFRLVSGLLQFPRMVKIQADNRRVMIEPEPRRVSIDPDYRRTSIRAEVRRHIVIPKDKRIFTIEGE